MLAQAQVQDDNGATDGASRPTYVRTKRGQLSGDYLFCTKALILYARRMQQLAVDYLVRTLLVWHPSLKC